MRAKNKPILVMGTAYQVVPDNEARDRIQHSGDFSSRDLWSDPAVKISASEFDSSKWINKPIRDTHGRVNIGRITGATLIGRDVKIVASFDDSTMEGKEAVTAFRRGERLAFSVKYKVHIDEPSGIVIRKEELEEVSICQQPHFDGCYIQVAANKSNNHFYKTSFKESNNQKQYLIVMAEATTAAQQQTQETKAPETTGNVPPVETEKAAQTEQATPATSNIPKATAEGEKAMKTTAEMAELIKRQELALKQSLLKIEEATKKAAEEEQKSALLAAHFQKQEDLRIQKERDQMAPYFEVLQEQVGEIPPETRQLLETVALDPNHGEYIRKVQAQTIAASKLIKEQKNQEALRNQEIIQQGRISVQAANVKSMMKMAPQQVANNPATRKSAIDVLSEVFRPRRSINSFLTQRTPIEIAASSAKSVPQQQAAPTPAANAAPQAKAAPAAAPTVATTTVQASGANIQAQGNGMSALFDIYRMGRAASNLPGIKFSYDQ